MTTLLTKHQRLAALRPLSPESVGSLAAAWDARMVYESNAIEGNSLTLRETAKVLANPMGVNVSGIRRFRFPPSSGRPITTPSKPPTPAISNHG